MKNLMVSYNVQFFTETCWHKILAQSHYQRPFRPLPRPRHRHCHNDSVHVGEGKHRPKQGGTPPTPSCRDGKLLYPAEGTATTTSCPHAPKRGVRLCLVSCTTVLEQRSVSEEHTASLQKHHVDGLASVFLWENPAFEHALQAIAMYGERLGACKCFPPLQMAGAEQRTAKHAALQLFVAAFGVEVSSATFSGKSTTAAALMQLLHSCL